MKFLPLLLLLAACSETPAPPATPAAEARPQTPPTPPVAEVREMIARSPEFADYQFTNASVTIPVAGSMMSEPARATARELAEAKWVAIDGAGDLMLTDRSRTDKRFLMRENGILDIVPLAKKEMGELREVRANEDGTASADFTWRWIPNEVGAVFTTGALHDRFAATHEARATLIWNGSSWAVLSIAPRD